MKATIKTLLVVAMSMLTGVYVGCGKDDTPDAGQQYTLTVLSAQPDWGIVRGGGSYAAGTEVEIVATANDGFEFNHWSDDTNNHNAVRTLTISSDTIIYANFSPRPEIGIYTFTVNGVTFSVYRVGAGSFMMGSADDDDDARANEKPAHMVTLTRTFFMGKYEVTQELYQAVMDTNPSHFVGANLPVEQVSYNDAMEFCARLSAQTGYTFTLPTEAQWEYAARGGHTGTHGYIYSGSGNIDEVAWYGVSSDDGGTTHPVGQKRPNTLGLYDMSGNVLEMCLDYIGGDYTAEPQTDPTGPEEVSEFHRVKGGAFHSYYLLVRIPTRYGYVQESEGSEDIGFRVVMYE